MPEEPADKQRDSSVIGRPFLPGQSGNPAGRPPKGKCIPDILRKIGDVLVAPDEKVIKHFGLDPEEKIPARDAMLYMVYYKAAKGSRDMINFIAERTEGKAPQTIAHEGLPGTEDKPLVILMGNGKKTEVKPGAESE